MQLTSQQTLPVSQAQAWEALNDTEMLKAAMPGCEAITPIGDGAYEVLVTASVGPVKAKFKGKLALADMNPPASYTLRFEGQGGAAGHAKGSADVRLEPQGDGSTVLHYTANAQVGGKLAQIGSRLVDMAAQKMAGEFFSRFTAALNERYHPAAAEPADDGAAESGEPAGLGSRLAAGLKKRFGSGEPG